MEKQNYYGLKVADLERYKASRAEAMKYKNIAISMQFIELDRILNAAKFSRRFFGKSQSWFAQRVKNYAVNGEKAYFTKEDYDKISEGYREIAKQLNQYADELDKAEIFD